MWKKTSIILAVLISGLFAFSSFDDDKNFETAKNLDIYYTLIKELNNYYVDEIDPGKIIKTSIDEMLNTLDPYTTFIPESKIEDYRFMTTGQYGGVGAMIRKSGDYVIITEVYEGFPADKAELKAGDAIYEIEDKSAKGLNSDDISTLLKGQPGTKFTLKVKRPNIEQLLEKEITREKITINSVPYHTVLDDSVGYLILSSFTQNCAMEVRKAFTDLKAQGINSLIFDLRGNPGGLLIESVKIVNLFVDQGQEVVSTRGKFTSQNSQYSTQQAAFDKDIPVTVLINSSSASASEIVSGALQDLDRAVIIGQRSYGKGLVQTTRELSYNSKLKVTTAKYYIPSGRCIQALDYSHRNEDGSVGKVPDSLISSYKTKNGRTVYDGGGIIPDVKVDQRELSIVSYELINESLIFDYATEFAQKHKSIAPADQFKLSDDNYGDFKSYVRNSNFEYQLESEHQLESLIDAVKEETYYSEVASQISELQEALTDSKKGDLEKHKKEIARLLESEIVGRFYYQTGQIKHELTDDPEVKKAIEILNDTNAYNEILTKQSN